LDAVAFGAAACGAAAFELDGFGGAFAAFEPAGFGGAFEPAFAGFEPDGFVAAIRS
jgi:hypothetical protein